MRAFHQLLTARGRIGAMTIGSPADAAYVLVSPVFSRRIRFVQSPSQRLCRLLTQYVDAKGVKPVIGGYHALHDIASADRALKAGGAFRKQVVQLL